MQEVWDDILKEGEIQKDFLKVVAPEDWQKLG